MEAPKTEKKSWYRLDNSAKIYPAVRSRSWASMFRVSLTLGSRWIPRCCRPRWRIRCGGSHLLPVPAPGTVLVLPGREPPAAAGGAGRGQPLQEDGKGGKRRLLLPGAVLPLPDCGGAVPFHCGRDGRHDLPQDPGGAVSAAAGIRRDPRWRDAGLHTGAHRGRDGGQPQQIRPVPPY